MYCFWFYFSAIGDSPMSKSQVNKNKKKRNALVEEKLAQQIKPNINLVVVGHVDAGKSTLMGHVLFKVGEVTQKEMHKCKMQAAANSKIKLLIIGGWNGHSDGDSYWGIRNAISSSLNKNWWVAQK
jgi:hypothetical protein